ncbi:hypothetical protein H4F26_20170 [Vibrio alginolyticus]|uniref:hypothetical protein n=1 Tax=Vibrio alginolyticus TaxID=663 RepID=UPI002FEFF685
MMTKRKKPTQYQPPFEDDKAISRAVLTMVTIYPLDEFIKANFRSNSEFARIHGVVLNTVYKMNANGDRNNYTLWYGKKSGNEQPQLL